MRFLVLAATIVGFFSFPSSLCFQNNGFHGENQRLHCHPATPESSAQTEKNLLAPLINEGYDYECYKDGYTTCQEETCQILGGEVPKDLSGTYFRNGHGSFEIGTTKQPVLHPFDGDGLVLAAQFDKGKVLFRNRFVRTKGFEKERNSKGVLYRNTFGTQRRGGVRANILDLDVKNVANTNVIYRSGRLFALWEGGLPYQLEADSLKTLGEDTFDGLLQSQCQLSAHPRTDPKSGNLIIPQTMRNPSKVLYTVFEFDQNMNVEKERSFEIPGFTFTHDFAVTENYYIFNQPPVKLNPLPFIFGQKCAGNCISTDPNSPSKLFLVPRDSEKDVEVIELDPHFSFHFANAFDEGPDKITFDLVKSDILLIKYPTGNPEKAEWRDLPVEKAFPYSTLYRYILEKDPFSGKWSYSSEQLSPALMEFPSVASSVSCQPHRYIYASCGADLKASPVQGLLKYDVQERSQTSWFGKEYEFLGESLFVAKDSGEVQNQDEDDGYVLSVLWNGKERTSELVVFDAKDIAKGPISRLNLPTAIPHGLHGSWVGGLKFDPEQVLERFQVTKGPEQN